MFPWAEGVEVGLLDPVINEASGIAVSARYGNRLYHVNDSGDTGRFFVTNLTGTDAQSVRVLGFNPGMSRISRSGRAVSRPTACFWQTSATTIASDPGLKLSSFGSFGISPQKFAHSHASAFAIPMARTTPNRWRCILMARSIC